jgi:hypothetical protein
MGGPGRLSVARARSEITMEFAENCGYDENRLELQEDSTV